MRVRFAPSPTGQLHVGNARTALFNWLLARGSGGAFILRIEDTDAERSTAESESAILDDLKWLGLDWDEGPDRRGDRGPYRQSERLPLYREHAERLLAGGDAYYCFCSADELEAARVAARRAGLPTRYSGRCRSLDPAESRRRVQAGEAAALRFRVPPVGDVTFEDRVRGPVTFHTDVIGDPIIVRSDGFPAYNFAVVVDDALMEVSDVVRGEDHISNTPRQLLLYRALGFEPPRFAHLSLVLGPDHSPLSKRHGATSVAEFRSRGYLPEALVNYLALIGWSSGGDEILSIDELVRRFSLDSVGHASGVFDEEKLAWVNRHYLRTANAVRVAALSVVFFVRDGFAMTPDAEGLAYLTSVMPMVTESVDRLDQVPDRLAFLFEYAPEDALRLPGAEDVRDESSRRVLEALVRTLAAAPRLDKDRFRMVATAIRQETGVKGRALFHPIRVALTGAPEGPELDLAVPALDRGAELPSSSGLPPIVGCRERALLFADALRTFAE
jgi:glutamyl-tRNA synthetase/nondiscriminating glutamyl-tRNA synthetase